MRLVLASLLVVAMGCGSSEDSTQTTPDGAVGADTAVVDTSTPAEDVATTDTSAPDTAVDPFGPYPTGPYGNKVGDVVANLDWEGYVSPLSDALANTKPYVTTSMDKLRRDAKKGYALVHVSEFY